MLVEAVRLCPALDYRGPCDIPTCEHAKKCRLTKQPWAGLCKIPASHPVSMIVAEMHRQRAAALASARQ
jgi:hypothetical protein